ncbi:MAG: hypothetical protein ABR579_04470 [Actinomycetota bacterium]
MKTVLLRTGVLLVTLTCVLVSYLPISASARETSKGPHGLELTRKERRRWTVATGGPTSTFKAGSGERFIRVSLDYQGLDVGWTLAGISGRLYEVKAGHPQLLVSFCGRSPILHVDRDVTVEVRAVVGGCEVGNYGVQARTTVAFYR